MASGHPANTWYRYVPRNRPLGACYVVLWTAVVALDVWALASGVYPTRGGQIGEAVVIVIALWALLAAVTGYAALGRDR